MPTAKEIIEMVDRKETDTTALRNRWDSDYSLWRTEPYTGLGENYHHYTSNEPRTNAKKAIGMLSGAAMKLQVPQDDADRGERDDDNVKERFLLGCFKANDERLVRMGEPPLLQWMAWSMMIRGTTCGRALFRRRNGNGRAIADATPWDPRDCFWEYGPEGLAWICHRFTMLRSAAERDWKLDRVDNPERQVVTFYDWYDGERNIIATDAQERAAKEEVHGLMDGDGEPLVPAWVNANTLQPLITLPHMAENTNLTEGQMNDSMADFGESIFADTRHQVETSQLIASIRLNLTKRSLKPVFSIKSPSGTKRVEFDPFIEGAEIALGENEELIVHPMLESAPDTDPLAAMVANEEQKGFFPAISFGNLPDPISGFAIQNLKGGVADKVMGGAQACSSALMSIANNWSDHFSTSAFGGVELSGQGRNRKWFSASIVPEDIQDLPQAEIELVPELPEDQAGKVEIASRLRLPGADGLPLKSDNRIREDDLQMQDADLEMDDILHQMAAQNPLIRAQRMTDALANRGDMDGAMSSHIQFQMLMVQLGQALSQVGTTIDQVMQSFNPETNETRNQDGEGGGFSPEVLPNAAQGIPSPTPGIDTPPQAGPFVPQGAPRPGARNGNGQSPL